MINFNFLYRYQSLFISFVGGCLYASGFPLFNGHSFFLGPLFAFGLFLYSLQIEQSALKRQMLCALSYSLGFYLLGFYWIPYTLSEFGGLIFPLNYLLGLLFALIIIPHFYLFTLIQRKIKNLCLLALIFVLLEQFTPQQFPAHLGQSALWLVTMIPLKLAPVFGAPIYSFITVLLALAVTNHLKSKKAPATPYAVVGLLCLLNFLLPSPDLSPENSSLNIRLVQPNIGNFIKIDSERGGLNSIAQVYQDYVTLSTKDQKGPIDLIIWPETAFPHLLISDMLKRHPEFQIPETLSQIIDLTKAELFIGGYDIKNNVGMNDFKSQYNSAFHFGSDKKLKDVYRKIRLIPFGEGLPFGPFNHALSKILTNVSFFAEGERFTLFKTQKGLPFISAICYEILFPDFIRDFLNHHRDNEPQFLINLTNDSWYGDTAEPYQHLFLAKWRAIEFNLPIIRSTNTGITTVIYPDGSEDKKLHHGLRDSLDLNLKFHKRKATIYQRYGLMMILILGVFFSLIEWGQSGFKREALF